MSMKEIIQKIQRALMAAGVKLVYGDDGVAKEGGETLTALEGFDLEIKLTKKTGTKPPPVPSGSRPQNPAYNKAKEYSGQSESKAGFVGWLSKFWPKAGLPSYKTIIGTSFAWCGLFVLAMNSEVGQKYVAGGAAARSWAKYGVEIDWKKNGIPKGAVIHINHNSNCSSGSGNHVTFADGDCTATELAKSGASFPGFGGNQGNAVKRSMYPVNDICEVRWPAEVEKPGPVTTSVNCQGSATSGESTR